MTWQLSHTELDTLRADAMRAMLNDEGRRYVWQYDVTATRTAFQFALHDQNYDAIQTDGEAFKKGIPYCLTGPGIEDHPFTTSEELLLLVHWLCVDGYLSCYTREVWRWQPHLQDDQQAVAALWSEGGGSDGGTD